MTLVEILVILSIIGLILGTGIPAMVRYSEQVRLKAATRQLVGLVSFARHQAISTRQAHAVYVDRVRHEVTVVNLSSGQAQDERVRLPSSVGVDVEVGGAPAEEPQIVFRPTGSLTGRTTALVLTDRGRRLTISVTGPTGAVTVQ